MSSSREVTIKYLADGAQAKAETKEVSREIDNVAKAAKASSNITSAANDNISKSARGAASAVAAYDREIIAARRDLAQLNSQIVSVTQSQGRNSQAAQELRKEYVLQSAALRQLVAEKAGLAVEAKAEAVIAAESAAAQKVLTAATESSGQGFSRLTTQVRTSGTIFQGFDGILQAGLGSIGGVTVLTSIFISMLGALVPKLIELGGATQRKIELDNEAATALFLLANAQSEVAAGSVALSVSYLNTNQSINAVALSGSNLVGAFTLIAEKQKDITKETEIAEKAYKDLTTTGYRQAEASIFISRSAADLRENIIDATESINEQTKEMAPAIEMVRNYQTITGATTEEVLRFAKENRLVADDALPAVRRALENDIVTLQKFASDLINSTNRMVDMRLAALSLTVALANIKPPSFDISGTLRGIENAVATAKGGLAATGTPSILRVDGIATEIDKMAVNKPNIDAVNKSLQEYARQHAQGATAAARSADAQRIYREQLRRQDNEIRGNVEHQNRAAEVTFNSANAHRSSAGAARSHANELSNLTKRIQEAQAALILDNFASRGAKIQADILGEARAAVIKKNFAAANRAEINKMDTLGEVAALGIKLGLNKKYFDDLATLQALLNAKVTNQKEEAERQSNLALTRMQIALIQDERTRREIAMRLDVQEYIHAEQQKYGYSKESQERIVLYRQILEAQFNEWLLKEMRTNAVKQRQTREEEERKLYENLRKLAIEQRSNRAGRAQIEEQTRADHDRAGGVFGDNLGAENANLLRKRLEAIDNFQFTGLLDSFNALLDKFNLANIAADSFANALQGAFHRAFIDGANFMEAFGKLLLAGFLSALGQQAIAEGTYHMLAGAAKLFNPLTAWAGAGEIAKGAALVAFGSALVAGGSAISGSIGKDNAAAAAGGGAGNSASGGNASGSDIGSRNTRQLEINSAGNSFLNPNTVGQFAVLDNRFNRIADSMTRVADSFESVNRSLGGNNPSPSIGGGNISISLGEKGAEKFLDKIIDGKGVVTIKTANGKHKKELKLPRGIGIQY